MATMATQQELEALDSVFLAIMCKKLAQDPTADAKASEQARQFKEEWLRLTARETSPGAMEQERVKREIAALKSRMAAFLAPYV